MLGFCWDIERQKRSGFRYAYSCYQLEYSRNLLFKSGRQLDEVYQGLVDRTRRVLDVVQLKTIFGRKQRGLLRPFDLAQDMLCGRYSELGCGSAALGFSW